MDYLKTFRLSRLSGKSTGECIDEFEAAVESDPRKGYWRYCIGQELYNTHSTNEVTEKEDGDPPACLRVFLSLLSMEAYTYYAKETEKQVQPDRSRSAMLRKILRTIDSENVSILVAYDEEEDFNPIICDLDAFEFSKKKDRNSLVEKFLHVAEDFMNSPAFDVYTTYGGVYTERRKESV